MRDRILILHDVDALTGRPDSSDTLVEAAAIGAALHELGYDTAVVPVGLDLAALGRLLAVEKPRLVFNLVESLEGRGQLLMAVPALLDSLRIPYTGCPTLALGLTSHKPLAKRWLLRAGVPTPASYSPQTAGDAQWIVKAVFEHASLGIDDTSIVRGAEAVERVLAARRAEFGGEWFAERFVPGRELNVSLLATEHGPRVLPVAEIRFEEFPPDKPSIVGYAAKWDTASFEYRNTPRTFAVEPELAARAERLARECWYLFALDGYARVDFRVDAAGVPWVLEINANPCLSPDAGFAAALEQGGIAYVAAIASLVAAALRRAHGSETIP
jgi:D-alanine-D-alanine ligase